MLVHQWRRSVSGGGVCNGSRDLSHSGGGVRNGSCIRHWRDRLSYYGGSVGDGGSASRICCWGGIRHGSDCLSHGGGGVSNGLLVHDGVESVDGVGGVVHSPSGAVGLHQAVAALDDVSAAGFVLALGVSGQSVLDVVSVAVLRRRRRVCNGCYYCLRYGSGVGCVGGRGAGVGCDGWCPEKAASRDGECSGKQE